MSILIARTSPIGTSTYPESGLNRQRPLRKASSLSLIIVLVLEDVTVPKRPVQPLTGTIIRVTLLESTLTASFRLASFGSGALG